LGKIPTTLVRRLISLLTRSNGLVDLASEEHHGLGFPRGIEEVLAKVIAERR
jgi:hypothetical protein